MDNPYTHTTGIDREPTILFHAWALAYDVKTMPYAEAMDRHEARMTKRILYMNQSKDIDRAKFSRDVVTQAATIRIGIRK